MKRSAANGNKPLITAVLSHYRREDALLLWLLFALFFSLPLLFCLALLLFVLVYPWLPPVLRANHHWIIATGLVTGFPLVFLTLPNWLAGESLLAAVTLIAVLKRAELDSNRDRLVLVVAVFICNSLNLVYWNNLPSLLHLLGLMLLVLTLLQRSSIFGRQTKWRPLMTVSLWALPLAVLLFLGLPRIPGPLWDVGLAFGLPLSVYQQELSVSMTTNQNSGSNDVLASLKAQQQVVLVAEFPGSVPTKSQLYWRGKVSYAYQNGEWLDSLSETKRSERLANGYRDLTDYQRQIVPQQAPVHYRIKIAPNGEYWLYAPDLPERNAQESFISGDGQLLSIRPLHDEFSYSSSSFLNASFRADETPVIKESELPPSDRANIEATAQQWQQLASTSTVTDKKNTPLSEEDIHVSLLAFLSAPPAWFDASAPFNGERLQRWVGISMLLLQRAGIPARMVSGYRGGDLIALSEVIVVRQKHAHHWLEIWSNEQGWKRLDVKDILTLNIEHKTAQKKITEQNLQPAPRDKLKTSRPKISAVQEEEERDFLPEWLKYWEAWLQGYNPQLFSETPTQTKQQNFSISLALWLPGLVAIWLFLLLIYRQHQQQLSQMEQAWQQLCAQLARQGFSTQTWECPSRLLHQLEERQPSWATAAIGLIHIYLQYNFSGREMKLTPNIYRAQVKRFVQALKQVDKPSPDNLSSKP